MYTRRHYGFWKLFRWSKKPFLYSILYATLITLVYRSLFRAFDFDISLNWQPITVLGIAVAFYLGFKNSASYDRAWEARKIWGGIVNNSRGFGTSVVSFVQGEHSGAIKKELIYRHIAWLTALRYQLRTDREWEHTENRMKDHDMPRIAEHTLSGLEQDILPFLGDNEWTAFQKTSNAAVQILRKQSQRLQELRDEGYFEDFRHMELHRLLLALMDEQGRSERIKNFPFPRQYASVAIWITLLFTALIPFGLLSIFSQESFGAVWLTIPFSALISWVFLLMEMIGDYSENPFEGTYNDVPITSISKGIEIDLRELIDDSGVPEPPQPVNGFLM
ncbi:bestrophin family ion channel [Flavobacterium sp. ST-75]|uniref:Bestrophin family ion channel n=1 Tax=Flavobacterium rhizophilum TaxID=3163296 RepID=A0ABW8YA55_9FLAO